jgi:peptidoglycan/LPS O-acetylase OafA/YrhL
MVITLTIAAFMLLSRFPPRLPHARFIGSITYPLYLLHAAIGSIALAAIVPLIGQWPALALVTVAMIAAAALVAKYVEEGQKPLWRALAARLTAPIAWIERALAARAAARKPAAPLTP